MSSKHSGSLLVFLLAHPIAFVVLAILRLTGIINWNWWFVCTPLLLILAEAIIGAVVGIYEFLKENNNEQ